MNIKELENNYIQIVYLFYDGFDESTRPKIETMDILKYVF